MKIAAVSLTRNDDFRLGPWKEYYQEYKDEIFEHIVVDNGSDEEYIQQLKEAFPSSTIIELGYNGGCTGAYNAGISYALQNPEIDAIMLIGNDVKIEKGGISKLYEILFSKKEFGMIGPVVLKKDSEIIESCGVFINLKNGSSKLLETGRQLKDIGYIQKIVSCVPGGVNIASSKLYRNVGLQDEKLFMYCDELDMGIRIQKAGYVEVVTSEVKCWHQHINYSENCTRSPITKYLMGRNYVYLFKKHFSNKVVTIDFLRRFSEQTFLVLRNIYSKTYRQNYYFYIRGMFAGLFSKMDNKFLSKTF